MRSAPKKKHSVHANKCGSTKERASKTAERTKPRSASNSSLEARSSKTRSATKKKHSVHSNKCGSTKERARKRGAQAAQSAQAKPRIASSTKGRASNSKQQQVIVSKRWSKGSNGKRTGYDCD